MGIMKRMLIVLGFILVSLVNFGQIIADHTIVDRYDDIPQQYIDEVKKMWFVIAGESHSKAYRSGLNALELLDDTYQVSARDFGTPSAATDQYFRCSPMMWGDYDTPTGWEEWIGEEDWWTSSAATNQVKTGISYCNDNSLTIAAMGFGWCWDATFGISSSGTDPITDNRWYGELNIAGNPTSIWGLDEDDNAVSGNSLNMDDYLSVTQNYINYCTDNSIPTKVIFTTGPVDDNNGGISAEAMYQGHLKWEHIREYVQADATRVLFDYADILCHDDDGTQTTSSWNGNTFPVITATNLGDESTGHIDPAGALRLAKATWWMMARIAGWDGDVSTGISNPEKDEPSSKFIVTNNEIRIEMDDSFRYEKVTLFNLLGSAIVDKIVDSQICKLDTAGLPAGVYLVVLRNSMISETRKVVVW